MHFSVKSCVKKIPWGFTTAAECLDAQHLYLTDFKLNLYLSLSQYKYIQPLNLKFSATQNGYVTFILCLLSKCYSSFLSLPTHVILSTFSSFSLIMFFLSWLHSSLFLSGILDIIHTITLVKILLMFSTNPLLTTLSSFCLHIAQNIRTTHFITWL